MSDAAITIVVAGVVQVAVITAGFLTLWVKLRYGVEEARKSAVKAEESATVAADKVQVVERKIDANTATTEAVNNKADTIVDQTNGNLDQLRSLVEKISERVNKLEDYNRDSSHRLLDAINAVHVKVAELSAIQGKSPADVEKLRRPG